VHFEYFEVDATML